MKGYSMQQQQQPDCLLNRASSVELCEKYRGASDISSLFRRWRSFIGFLTIPSFFSSSSGRSGAAVSVKRNKAARRINVSALISEMDFCGVLIETELRRHFIHQPVQFFPLPNVLDRYSDLPNGLLPKPFGKNIVCHKKKIFFKYWQWSRAR